MKAMKARAELEQMRAADQLAMNKKEVEAGAKQRAAQRAVDKGDPFMEEQKKLEAERKKKEQEEELKRQDSRRKLKEKASLWN